MKITVCIGSSCHIKGSRQVVEQLQQLEGGQLPVAGGGVLGKDDVPALLAAQRVAALLNALVHVFIAHVGLDIGNAFFVKCLEKT